MTATLPVVTPVIPLSFRLAASSDSGVSNSDQITNVSRPVFVGRATPYSIVQVYAARNGSQPTETRYLGQAIVNANGDWSLWSTFLPDGWYTVSAVETPTGGSPSAPVALPNPLVIDTVGPRVAGLAVDGPTNHVTVVLSDVGAGLDPASADDPNAYTIVPPSTIIGAHPNPARGQGPIGAPSISGFYSSADSYTVGSRLQHAPTNQRTPWPLYVPGRFRRREGPGGQRPRRRVQRPTPLRRRPARRQLHRPAHRLSTSRPPPDAAASSAVSLTCHVLTAPPLDGGSHDARVDDDRYSPGRAGPPDLMGRRDGPGTACER